MSREPSLYELVTKLRVTRTKARNRIYDQELRRLDTEELDLRMKAALTTPLLPEQGELFVLEIENPLIIDHLRAKLQALGHASDGSFSPSLVRMTLDAVAALIEDYLSKPERTAIKQAMVEAGEPDSSFLGVLKSTIRAIAKKVAQDSGDALVEKASSYLAPIVDGAVEQLPSKLDGLFEQAHKSVSPVGRA